MHRIDAQTGTEGGRPQPWCLLVDEITQADEGCDFKFPANCAETPDPDIF